MYWAKVVLRKSVLGTCICNTSWGPGKRDALYILDFHQYLPYFCLEVSICINHLSEVVASCWLQELGTGVLTTSKNEKGGQLTDSVSRLTCRLPISPRLLLWLLGSHLVDIGIKLQLVHFAVQFCSASGPPRLRRTWLQSTHYPISSQVGLSATKLPQV